MNNMNKKSGFTLIELLVVITIIGILVALIVPNVLTDKAAAQEAALRGILGNVRTAIHNFRLNQLATTNIATLPTTAEVSTGILNGPFPANPFNGNNTIVAVSVIQAANRTTIGGSPQAGWAYNVDGDTYTFYANSTVITKSGIAANEL